MELNDNDLTLLGLIRPGETINISTKEIVIHRSWYASTSRWWNYESRSGLPNWIESVMMREVNSYSIMFRKDLMDTQRDKILLAISGIRNLCITYSGDPIATRLSQIINRIEENMFKINHPATRAIEIQRNNNKNFWPYPSTY